MHSGARRLFVIAIRGDEGWLSPVMAGETAMNLKFKSGGVALSHAAKTDEASEPDCASSESHPFHFVPPAVAPVDVPPAVARSAASRLA